MNLRMSACSSKTYRPLARLVQRPHRGGFDGVEAALLRRGHRGAPQRLGDPRVLKRSAENPAPPSVDRETLSVVRDAGHRKEPKTENKQKHVWPALSRLTSRLPPSDFGLLYLIGGGKAKNAGAARRGV